MELQLFPHYASLVINAGEEAIFQFGGSYNAISIPKIIIINDPGIESANLIVNGKTLTFKKSSDWDFVEGMMRQASPFILFPDGFVKGAPKVVEVDFFSTVSMRLEIPGYAKPEDEKREPLFRIENRFINQAKITRS